MFAKADCMTRTLTLCTYGSWTENTWTVFQYFQKYVKWGRRHMLTSSLSTCKCRNWLLLLYNSVYMWTKGHNTWKQLRFHVEWLLVLLVFWWLQKSFHLCPLNTCQNRQTCWIISILLCFFVVNLFWFRWSDEGQVCSGKIELLTHFLGRAPAPLFDVNMHVFFLSYEKENSPRVHFKGCFPGNQNE